jgi:hypothetical protein
MWFDWQSQPELFYDQLKEICPTGEYRVVTPSDLPAGIISTSLLKKTHSILVLCSGTANGRVYAMLNLNRIDGNEVDQMPYAIAFEGNQPIPSGVLIQHGDYPGRTTPLPGDFYEYIAVSGTYPLKEMPEEDRGSIKNLNIGSQEEALRLLVETLAEEFPE